MTECFSVDADGKNASGELKTGSNRTSTDVTYITIAFSSIVA